MEVILVTRNRGAGAQAPSTADLRLFIGLDTPPSGDRVVTQLPSSEWAGNPSSNKEHGAHEPVDWTNKTHTLPGFSALGSGRANEFATWTTGREKYLSSPKLREQAEDDLRSFAERSDHTEGFMLSTSISDGFGGLSSVFLESLRDEFTKSTIFTTANLSDAVSWHRDDTERSKAQRLLNSALSIQHLEDLSSMLLPIAPPASWEPETPWAAYLRDDLRMQDTYSQILTMHLQSANSELREIDGLTSIVNQLNWRGDNKIAHLTGAAPLLPPDMLKGVNGQKKLKSSLHDFSVYRGEPNGDSKPTKVEREEKSFASYGIVRGYEDEENQEIGAALEKSTPLREPLSQWISLPQPFPILPSATPIFRSLHPEGRPLNIELPPHPEPFSRAGLFGLPDPIFPPNLSKTYYVQPDSIPILTTLETSTAARHLLRYLSTGVKEMMRTRSSVLWEYEEGEFGLGREGLSECRERLETLADGLANAGGLGDEDEEGSMDEDEAYAQADDDDDGLFDD